MQCGDLVVEVIPALVKAAGTPGNHFIEDAFANNLFARGLFCQVRDNLQQIQDAPGITVGRLGQPVAQLGGEFQLVFTEPVFIIIQGGINNAAEFTGFESFQNIGSCAGQQCAVQFKGRVFCSGTNKYYRAVFDIGQKGILLNLVEAVCLIYEECCLA